ncbi:MAG: hypothetical protein ACRCVT_01600 [Leadbetterella sp.]
MNRILGILFLLFLSTTFSSCWAPRCPQRGCRVRMEHQHSDQTTGVFIGRHLHIPRMHYLWDKKTDRQDPTAGGFGNESPQGHGPKKKKKKQKFKRKMVWEQ